MHDNGIVNVYLARDLLEAEFLRNVLDVHGIETRIFGANSIQSGMLPNEEAAPCLWVRRRDEEHARELLAEWEMVQARRQAGDVPSESMWNCSNCGEMVEDIFDMCWKCQTPRNTSPPGAESCPTDL